MAEPFIGQVDLYGFDFAPEKWARCEGQTMTIYDNQALFSLLGNAYGGDGRSTFALPDLRGKLGVSQGCHPGSAYDWKIGQQEGVETHTMVDTELPKHSHLATYAGDVGDWKGIVSATELPGDSAIPATGSMRATSKPPGGGLDKPEKIYFGGTPDENTLVACGGLETIPAVMKGTVTIGNNGASESFEILQSSLVMNFSIAQQGLYPSRS